MEGRFKVEINSNVYEVEMKMVGKKLETTFINGIPAELAGVAISKIIQNNY